MSRSESAYGPFAPLFLRKPSLPRHAAWLFSACIVQLQAGVLPKPKHRCDNVQHVMSGMSTINKKHRPPLLHPTTNFACPLILFEMQLWSTRWEFV